MQNKNKFTKTETALTIYLITFIIITLIFMTAFHCSKEENKELKIKLEQCK